MMRLLAILALILLPLAAAAVEPNEVLDDPALEARARDISRSLRCVVCQNQSIDDSDAQIAKDLRLLVRERLSAGDSDEEVVAYVTARYGDFVLLRPPMKTSTYLLWFGPAALLLLALLFIALRARRKRQTAAEQPLSAAERKRLEKLLKDE